MTTKNAVGKLTFAVVALLGLHGCSRDHPVPAKVGPDTTVTVEIIGVFNESNRPAVFAAEVQRWFAGLGKMRV